MSVHKSSRLDQRSSPTEQGKLSLPLLLLLLLCPVPLPQGFVTAFAGSCLDPVVSVPYSGFLDQSWTRAQQRQHLLPLLLWICFENDAVCTLLKLSGSRIKPYSTTQAVPALSLLLKPCCLLLVFLAIPLGQALHSTAATTHEPKFLCAQMALYGLTVHFAAVTSHETDHRAFGCS